MFSMSTSFRFKLLLVVLNILGARCYQLNITPSHVVVDADDNNVTVTCSTEVRLTACQISWYDARLGQNGQILDLSAGVRSKVNPAHLDQKLLGYSYNGRGLDSGDCGVTLYIQGKKEWMVGCRVHAEKGSWVYAWMDLIANNLARNVLTVSPVQLTVLPGDTTSYLCRASEALSECEVTVPNPSGYDFNLTLGGQSVDPKGRYSYKGAGLPAGECGVTTRETGSGLAKCTVDTELGGFDTRLVPLSVARPPRAPKLQLDVKVPITEATCSVSNFRHPVNITWLIDDEIVEHEGLDQTPFDKKASWWWPWKIASVSQYQSLVLRPNIYGKTLKCRVSHVTLAEPLEASQVIVTPGGCPPLMSHTLVIRCRLYDNPIDCSLRHLPDTVARLSCVTGYERPNQFHGKLTCLESGEWNRRLINCNSGCGIRNQVAAEVLISGGENSTLGEFPWHVAIYHQDPADDTPKQICGGTLISTTIIISAAHCFYNNMESEQIAETQYKVAVGKLIRVWDDPDPMVQKRSRVHVHLPKEFRGRHLGFAADIAVLRVPTAFRITDRVNVACLEWNEAFESDSLEGKKGIVAGWGISRVFVQATTLKYIELPYVSHENCYESLTDEQRPFVTADKFCAGYIKQNKSVCGGDSGGGILFQDGSNGRYYLRGVVSLGFTPSDYNGAGCYDEHYGGFTSLSPYHRWIDGYLRPRSN